MLNAKTNDNKNLVLILVSDSSGCSHYRLRYKSSYFGAVSEQLGFTPVLLPSPLFDFNYLAMTKAIIMQRPIADVQIEWAKRYKALQPKFGFKLIFELDDQVFNIDGQCVPEYNSASLNFKGDHLTENCRKVLPLFVEVVV